MRERVRLRVQSGTRAGARAVACQRQHEAEGRGPEQKGRLCGRCLQVYAYQGKTADGRPFYRGAVHREHWLYYDAKCSEARIPCVCSHTEDFKSCLVVAEDPQLFLSAPAELLVTRPPAVRRTRRMRGGSSAKSRAPRLTRCSARGATARIASTTCTSTRRRTRCPWAKSACQAKAGNELGRSRAGVRRACEFPL